MGAMEGRSVVPGKRLTREGSITGERGQKSDHAGA